eukprot:GEMP01003103.1.p1 GENE.GEMP01003103.1~~GEMP01003103.1.p1  ORF type:complete len:719 (+),score=195.44 GEMP01003103.1:197-2353(+)
MIPYYRDPRGRMASLKLAKYFNDNLDCTVPSIDLNPTCCNSVPMSAPSQLTPSWAAMGDTALVFGTPNNGFTQPAVPPPPDNRTCVTNSHYRGRTVANNSAVPTTLVLTPATSNYYGAEDQREPCIREPRGPKLGNERPNEPKVVFGKERSGDAASKEAKVASKEDSAVRNELVDQWLDTGVGDVANEDNAANNTPTSNSNNVTISISISTTNNNNNDTRDAIEESIEETSVTMMPHAISPQAMTSRTLSPRLRIACLDKQLTQACGDEDDVYPETTPRHCAAWPDVIIQRPPDNQVPRVLSMEPPTHWVYFTHCQLMRFFSDRQRMNERITSIRTLTVVGDHALMLAHCGIRLPANEEEDLEEIIFGTALDTASPLFLLPHASFGHLAAQVVFCDNVGGALTPQRCDNFANISAKYGARVWAMCGVPFAVCDAKTSMLLSLNEYAVRALRQYYRMDQVPLQLHAFNAEDRWDLMLLLRMAPALHVDGAVIGPDAFVYFLLQYNGTKSLASLHSDFIMRRVGKSRRKALDCVEIDPLAVLRVFDQEMGQSAECIAQRLEILSEALERVKEEQMECSRASREETARLLEVSIQDKQSQDWLVAELEESQRDAGKWKSYAEELLAELGKSHQGGAAKPHDQVYVAADKEGAANDGALGKPSAQEEETLSVECGDIETAGFMSPRSIKSSLASENDQIHHYGLGKFDDNQGMAPQACCSIQ